MSHHNVHPIFRPLLDALAGPLELETYPSLIGDIVNDAPDHGFHDSTDLPGWMTAEDWAIACYQHSGALLNSTDVSDPLEQLQKLIVKDAQDKHEHNKARLEEYRADDPLTPERESLEVTYGVSRLLK